MTRHEVATKVAEQTGISLVQAEKAVEAVMGIITDAVCSGGKVTLRGFGTFKTIVRQPKKARDISRGETITLPATKKPVFKPCNSFVSRVRK